MSERRYALCLALVAALVLVQSAAHLVAALPLDDVGSMVDLERSNSVPDIVSSVVIILAAAGAVLLGSRRQDSERLVAFALAGAIGLVAVEDVLHRRVGSSSVSGLIVLVSAVFATALLATVGSRERLRVRWTLGAGVAMLVASLVTGVLDRPIPWLERERGERIAELLIVADEGLELAGWMLVALALWDATLHVRATTTSAHHPLPAPSTPTASRPPAASTRRAGGTSARSR